MRQKSQKIKRNPLAKRDLVFLNSKLKLNQGEEQVEPMGCYSSFQSNMITSNNILITQTKQNRMKSLIKWMNFKMVLVRHSPLTRLISNVSQPVSMITMNSSKLQQAVVLKQKATRDMQRRSRNQLLKVSHKNSLKPNIFQGCPLSMSLFSTNTQMVHGSKKREKSLNNSQLVALLKIKSLNSQSKKLLQMVLKLSLILSS